MQEIDSSSPATLMHGWQQRMCSRINLELGSTIRFAGTDDSMTLVESSEVAGFRGRNLAGALIDRLKLKIRGTELTRERLAIGDSKALLQRYSEAKDLTVWLFIDDVDATFLNTDIERLKASTFFSACRNLVGSVSGLNIRASVRTDVWAILRQYDEALDKCEQYMLDLRWSTEDSGKILNNKINSFFHRTRGLVPITNPISKEIFREPFYWGRRRLEAFRPIHILSAGRPRWATQLCRLAGKNAFQLQRRLIGMSDIKSVMKEYGQFRLSDLYKEHSHQCNKLEVIVESFAGGPPLFLTHELLQHIRKTVIERFGMPSLDGIDIEPRELAVAHFLFRIGFINARDNSSTQGEALHFIRFEDRPHLLKGKQNMDDGLPWEVHPAYRSVLRMEGALAEFPDSAMRPRSEKHKPSKDRHGKPPTAVIKQMDAKAMSARPTASKNVRAATEAGPRSPQSRRRSKWRSSEGSKSKED
jgi:hypothetical protein